MRIKPSVKSLIKDFEKRGYSITMYEDELKAFIGDLLSVIDDLETRIEELELEIQRLRDAMEERC